MDDAAENFPINHIKSWADLTAVVEHFSYYSAHDWLFRGVTDEKHDLIAKIGREETRGYKSGKRVQYNPDDELALISLFKSQARSHIQQVPTTHLEWLALAQHFGAPTRLLDWTESILIAAWFAVEKGGAKSNGINSAIWITKKVESIDTESKINPLKIETPTVYRPAYLSSRIASQASVLMVCPDPKNRVNLEFSQKITIEKSIEFTLKKRLNTCGINRRLLFPDLQGLAEHLAWLYKNDYLAGHRLNNTRKKVKPTPDSEDH